MVSDLKGESFKMTDNIYPDEVFEDIGEHAAWVNQVAPIIGVDPVGIAAALAEEFNDGTQANAAWDFLKNNAFDQVTDLLNNSHNSILQNYNYVKGLPSTSTARTNPGFSEKLSNVVLRDVGDGNIKISTAIDLLHSYLDGNSSDPLNLVQYKQDYGKLVGDLISNNNGLQAKFAGLMVKEAQDWFSSKMGTDWDNLSAEQKVGLTTTYYNIGKERIEARWDEAISLDFPGSYDPQPSGDGVESIDNYDLVARILP